MVWSGRIEFRFSLALSLEKAPSLRNILRDEASGRSR